MKLHSSPRVLAMTATCRNILLTFPILPPGGKPPCQMRPRRCRKRSCPCCAELRAFAPAVFFCFLLVVLISGRNWRQWGDGCSPRRSGSCTTTVDHQQGCRHAAWVTVAGEGKGGSRLALWEGAWKRTRTLDATRRTGYPRATLSHPPRPQQAARLSPESTVPSGAPQWRAFRGWWWLPHCFRPCPSSSSSPTAHPAVPFV